MLWALTGAFLIFGAGISLLLWLGPPQVLAHPHIRELGAIADVIAVLLWMLVFAVSMTWGDNDTDKDDGDKRAGGKGDDRKR